MKTEYIVGKSLHPLLCRWWLRTRPNRMALQMHIPGEPVLPPVVECYVPWWAWPLELLHILIFGRDKLTPVRTDQPLTSEQRDAAKCQTISQTLDQVLIEELARFQQLKRPCRDLHSRQGFEIILWTLEVLDFHSYMCSRYGPAHPEVEKFRLTTVREARDRLRQVTTRNG